MPPIFVQEFMKNNKCPHCKAHKVPEKSLCKLHLAKARVYFRIWSAKRKEEGLCIRCNCKSFQGFLRCRLHTHENRLNCRRWMKVNGAGVWQKRKAETIKTGICAYCRANPRLGETYRCLDCKLRHQMREKSRATR